MNKITEYRRICSFTFFIYVILTLTRWLLSLPTKLSVSLISAYRNVGPVFRLSCFPLTLSERITASIFDHPLNWIFNALILFLVHNGSELRSNLWLWKQLFSIVCYSNLFWTTTINEKLGWLLRANIQASKKSVHSRLTQLTKTKHGSAHTSRQDTWTSCDYTANIDKFKDWKRGGRDHSHPRHLGRSSQNVEKASRWAVAAFRTDRELHVGGGAETLQQETREHSVLLLQHVFKNRSINNTNSVFGGWHDLSLHPLILTLTADRKTILHARLKRVCLSIMSVHTNEPIKHNFK